ncbi:MAG: hypothetical protein K2M75_05250 [Clostridia bacterium]|nr:hypothetical protein [Clostridia bacterium]
MNSSHRDRAYKLALIAIMAATLEGGKLALASIPGVEIVTLLCAVYGYVFGICGIIATYIFVGLETLIWGVNTWVISYIIHWGCVAFVFMLLGKFKIRNRLIATATAVILTTTFGVLTSLIDTGLLTGFWNNFWKRFAIMYVRGTNFYIVQIICNLLLFLIVFKPLVKLFDKILPYKFRNLKF